MNSLYNSRDFNDKIILNHICYDILSQNLSPGSLWKCDKEKNNDFTFIFVDGRNHEFSHLEYLASFKSTKLFSKYNYKILVFVPNTTNFLGNYVDLNNWRIEFIKIDPINSHDNYSEFMIKKLPWLIPDEYCNLIFFQSDSFHIKNGWEDKIKHLAEMGITYAGSPWQHYAGIELKMHNQWHDLSNEKNMNLISVGNGATSFRTLPSIRNISYYTKDLILRERGTESKNPPEDLHYAFFSQIFGKLPTRQQAAEVFTDPITLEEYKNKTSYCCHFPKYKKFP